MFFCLLVVEILTDPSVGRKKTSSTKNKNGNRTSERQGTGRGA